MNEDLPQDPGSDDVLEAEGPLPVQQGDMDAETLVRRALDMVESARAMPLSTSVLVQREELAGLLEDALGRLPDEVRRARWLLRERDEFLASRQREADELLDEVRVQAERMIQRSEIVRQSHQVAQRILDDAREEARRLRHEAEDYCDQKLAAFEIVLERTMKTVQAGRERLASTPASPEEPVGSPSGAVAGDRDAGSVANMLHDDGGGAGPGGGGFFDQDQP
ncbi:MAG: ATP synthase subunit B family protein [Acidimicrobiales bacterium]